MPKDVVEAYDCLWHYTTAKGLLGIVESQELWATSIKFLNDLEEFSGFFDRRLRALVAAGVRVGADKFNATEAGQRAFREHGGRDAVEGELIDAFGRAITSVTLKLEPYVVSFCGATAADSDDGLLSQWRGYGLDGGYALIFDSKGLNELLREEQLNWLFAFGHWGDVDYHVDSSSQCDVHDESKNWEEQVRSTVAEATLARLNGGDQTKELERLFDPIVTLATRHKHGGFHEEREVRIVIGALGKDEVSAAQQRGDRRQGRPVHFTVRDGLLIPHISAFSRPDGSKAKLPIRKVVVGPHPDKERRKIAVEMLLARLLIDAPVVVSSIPYIGR